MAALEDGRLSQDEYDEIYPAQAEARKSIFQTIQRMAQPSKDLQEQLTEISRAARESQARLLERPSMGTIVTLSPNWDAEQVAVLRGVEGQLEEVRILLAESSEHARVQAELARKSSEVTDRLVFWTLLLVGMTAALAVMTFFLVFPPFWNDVLLPFIRDAFSIA